MSNNLFNLDELDSEEEIQESKPKKQTKAEKPIEKIKVVKSDTKKDEQILDLERTLIRERQHKENQISDLQDQLNRKNEEIQTLQSRSLNDMELIVLRKILKSEKSKWNKVPDRLAEIRYFANKFNLNIE